MLNIKVIYNDKCKESMARFFDYTINPMFEYFNEDEPKDLKKAWKYKGEAGAKQVPFVSAYEDGKLIKAFYNEDKSTNDFFGWLHQYIENHAKKGWISVTKMVGKNNENIPEGTSRIGYTDGFMEGISLLISTPSNWFHTSIVKSIDWENKTFETLNSTYSFTFNEEESEHQQEDQQSGQ